MSILLEKFDLIRFTLDEIQASIAPPPPKVDPFAKGRITLDHTFTARPTFAPSKAMPLGAAAVPALDDPNFQWRAGYKSASLARSVTTAWRTGRPYPGFSWLSGNKELATFPNADAIALTGLDPITSDGESLILSAQKPSAEYLAHLPAGMPTDYVSGAINSFPFAQAHGVFEMVAEIPKGRGLWPAFWLLPVDMQWPPEIDIMEVLGHDTSKVYTTVHYAKADGAPTKSKGQGLAVADLSEGLHKYALRWTAETMTWAVDDEVIFTVPTPPSLHNRPCYILVDLTVGGPGSWPGAPDEDTVFPAAMKVRSIKAWTL